MFPDGKSKINDTFSCRSEQQDATNLVMMPMHWLFVHIGEYAHKFDCVQEDQHATRMVRGCTRINWPCWKETIWLHMIDKSVAVYISLCLPYALLLQVVDE